MAADAGKLVEVSEGSLANHLATVLSARSAALMSGWNGEMDDEFRRKAHALRVLCRDIVGYDAVIITRSGCGSIWSGLRKRTRLTKSVRWNCVLTRQSSGRTWSRRSEMPLRC